MKMFARGMNKVFLVSSRTIEPGEELFFDYNFKQRFEWIDAYDKKFLTGSASK